MRLYRDEAIVIGSHKLGEADKIIVLLTRNHGQIRAVAKGVRRTKSKFGSRLEQFMVIDVQLHEGRNLDLITQAETVEPFGGWIAADYEAYTAAAVMAETAGKLTETDASTRQQYFLLISAVRSLCKREHEPRLSLDAYLLRALSAAGWAPSLGDCAQCGAAGPHRAFAPDLGGVVCSRCRPPGAAAAAVDTIVLLAALLAGQWDVADHASDHARREAHVLVSAYVQWHLERNLRSLRMVERA